MSRVGAMGPGVLGASSVVRRRFVSACTGQLAVVTGASSGIGRAIAIALAARGAATLLVGRSAEALHAVALEAGAFGPPVRGYIADLSDDHDLQKLTAQLCVDAERLDVLVHSAGVILHGAIESGAVDDFDRQYRTNVRAPFVLTQALLSRLKINHGQVVFVNSSVVLAPCANAGAYAASKHALKGLADALRTEVNPAGVRVLSVYPGRTAGPLQMREHEREGKPYAPERMLQPADVASAVVSALALPRTAELTDLYIRPSLRPF